MYFCPAFLGMKLIKWFHNLLMVEIIGKSLLPNSIFRPFISFICGIKNKNVSEHLSLYSKTFIRKALALTLQSVSLKLKEMSQIGSYIVQKILENVTERADLSNSAGLLL